MTEVKDEVADNKANRRKQYFGLACLLILLGLIFFGVNYLIQAGNNKGEHKQKKEDEKLNLDLATYAIKGDKLWQNNFDDRLLKEKLDRDSQYEQMSRTILELEGKLQQEKNKNTNNDQGTIVELKEQMMWIKKELSILSSKQQENKNIDVKGNITSIKITEPSVLQEPKDMNNYIPAGSFISGILRGGISTSTATNSPGEPTPVFIAVTGYGDLPKSFKADLTNCRLIGSSYGNISNERVIARVETLSCTDLGSGLVTETDILGVVHSSDSKNGVKGTVVSMSDKHLKNAFIGGILSGFAQTGKQGEMFLFNPAFGATSQKKPGFKEKLGENSVAGLGSAAEKIADYHLKMAEATSPVIEVPGGARVTIFFSKGVFLGSNNIKEQIAKERR